MATIIENEPCYIFHVRDYQENSQILEAISLHYGALSIMVRGGKSQNSPTKGLFQPFVPLKLTLKASRTDLYFLNGYEYCDDGYDFKMPYYFCAMYINELLHHLYHAKEPDALLFGCYIETLEAIKNKQHIETSLRHFELTLLSSLGYKISLCDEHGHPLESQERYRFCFGFGFVKHDERLLRYRSISSSHSEEASDDGMLFSKYKVKGRRMDSAVRAPHMGYEYFQQGFSEEQNELLQKYYEYAQELIGPVLTGEQISKIISLDLTDADTARNAKLLLSGVIGKLLQGREIVSRRLYKDYVQLKAAKKAQASRANVSSSAPAPAPISNNAIGAPAPQNSGIGSNMTVDQSMANDMNSDHDYSTPEAYLKYAVQNSAQDPLAVSAHLSQHYQNSSQAQESSPRPYRHYVAQFSRQAAEANSDYEDIPEFNLSHAQDSLSLDSHTQQAVDKALTDITKETTIFSIDKTELANTQVIILESASQPNPLSKSNQNQADITTTTTTNYASKAKAKATTKIFKSKAETSVPVESLPKEQVETQSLAAQPVATMSPSSKAKSKTSPKVSKNKAEAINSVDSQLEPTSQDNQNTTTNSASKATTKVFNSKAETSVPVESLTKEQVDTQSPAAQPATTKKASKDKSKTSTKASKNKAEAITYVDSQLEPISQDEQPATKKASKSKDKATSSAKSSKRKSRTKAGAGATKGNGTLKALDALVVDCADDSKMELLDLFAGINLNEGQR